MSTTIIKNIAQALISVTTDMEYQNYDYDFDDFALASYHLEEILDLLKIESIISGDSYSTLVAEAGRIKSCVKALCNDSWGERVDRLLRTSLECKTGGWTTASNFASAVMHETSKMTLGNSDYDLMDYRYAYYILTEIAYSVSVSCHDEDQLNMMLIEGERLSDCIDELQKRWNEEQADEHLKCGGEKTTFYAQMPSCIPPRLYKRISEDMQRAQSRLDTVQKEAKKS